VFPRNLCIYLSIPRVCLSDLHKLAMSRSLLFALALLVPASSALRLSATRQPSRRLGRPVAQTRDDGPKTAAQKEEEAASTAGKGFGPPRQSTDEETAAMVNRGQKALEEMRAQAGAPPVLKKEPEMYIPTQKEKARHRPQRRRPAAGIAARRPPAHPSSSFALLAQTADRRTPRGASCPCLVLARPCLRTQDTIAYGLAGFLILGGFLSLIFGGSLWEAKESAPTAESANLFGYAPTRPDES
jgi:hypothetical protein